MLKSIILMLAFCLIQSYKCRADYISSYLDTLTVNKNTIIVDDPKSTYLPNEIYSINADWYVRKRNTGTHIQTDSVRLYFPIIYFRDSLNPSYIDTLAVVENSVYVDLLKIPILSNCNTEKEILRFTKINLPYICSYTIHKSISGSFISECRRIDISKDKIYQSYTCSISHSKQKKISKYLTKGHFRFVDKSYMWKEPSIIIEAVNDAGYYFINKGVFDISRNKSEVHLLKCFKILEKSAN